ncbi:MAG: GC-type dockerin domain-anchored protein [Planctomycetota bacterium]
MNRFAQLLLVTVSAFIPVAHADTLRVPQDFPTLGVALSAAQPGDEILLASGTFEADIATPLIQVNEITIRGSGVDETFIVPSPASQPFEIMLAWRQGTPDPLDITITDLTIDGFAGGDPEVSESYRTMLRAEGVFFDPEGIVQLIDVRFRNALKPFDGTVDLNSLDSAIVEDCVFENLDSEAGALYIDNVTRAIVLRSRFLGNGGFGAPINISDFNTAAVADTFVTGTASRVTVGSGHIALSRGGLARITNCSFGAGGASTVRPNAQFAQIDLSDVTAEFVNCAFGPADVFDADGRNSTATFTRCIGPGVPPVNDNIVGLPGYADPGDPGPDMLWQTADDNPGDLRPSTDSPMIDAAFGDFIGSGFRDVFGNPRLVDLPDVADTGGGVRGFLDIGAIEVEDPCPGDINRDGSLNSSDFFAWATAFTGEAFECDVNRDGFCTSSDFFAWVTIFTGQGCD